MSAVIPVPLYDHRGVKLDPLENLSDPQKVRKSDAVWWDRISEGEKKRDENRPSRRRFLDQFEKGYWGNWSKRDRRDFNGVDYNLPYAWVQTILPQVLFDEPSHKTKARMPLKSGSEEMVDRMGKFADALTHILDYTYEVCGLQEENRVIVFRALLEGKAWSKDTWDMDRRMRSVQFVEADSVFVDPFAGHTMRRARWVIQRIVRPAEEVYEDPMLEIPRSFKPNWSLSEEDREERGGYRGTVRRDQRDLDNDAIRYYEVWSKPAGKDPEVFVLYAPDKKRSKYGGSFEWPFALAVDDWPFIPLIFNSKFDEVDGFSHLQSIESYYKGLNELATYIYRRSKKSCTDKVLIDEGLDEQQVGQKVASGVDLEIIEVPLDDKRKDPVQILSFPEMNRDILTAKQMMEQSQDTVLGLSDLVTGGSGRNFETATEARVSEDAAATRLRFTVSQVEAFLTKQALHGAQNTLFLSDSKRLRQILGPEWGTVWPQNVDIDEIIYLFQISIEPGSTQRKSERQRQEEAMAFVQASLQFAQFGVVNVQALFIELLNAFDKSDHERFIVPAALQQAMSQRVQLNNIAGQRGAGGAPVEKPTGQAAVENRASAAQAAAGGIRQ